jgi:hypothetical protein|tara:strand:+ start:634 stop:804 length:171 start_codon:yes stop_codon:yes gene_type:complete
MDTHEINRQATRLRQLFEQRHITRAELIEGLNKLEAFLDIASAPEIGKPVYIPPTN